MEARLRAYEDLLDSLLTSPESDQSAERAWVILNELAYYEVPEHLESYAHQLVEKAKLVIEKWYGVVDPANFA